MPELTPTPERKSTAARKRKDSASEMAREVSSFTAKLKRLIKEMPSSVEIIVRHNSIDICEAGARQAYFDEHGDADNVPTLENIFTSRTRIYPGGESL